MAFAPAAAVEVQDECGVAGGFGLWQVEVCHLVRVVAVLDSQVVGEPVLEEAARGERLLVVAAPVRVVLVRVLVGVEACHVNGSGGAGLVHVGS
jgi:hypothetical protein